MKSQINKVRIITNRKGAIQILNALLEKVNSGYSVTPKDDFEKISQTVNILKMKRLKISDFLNKDKCSDISYNGFGELEIFKIRRNVYEIRLTSAYTNRDAWKAIASQYLNTKWLVTTFSYELDYIRNLKKETIEDFLFLENINGYIRSHECSFDKLLGE